ncbi:hypothetical protein FQ707_03220 [Bacteroidaceae bacterium HV4-6-C5C]|jgi:hypothetical protein|nr:hypothetical protein FQ707_03220 [Bacteroidaceae bacterium HV4-6-C5C]
MKRLLFFYYIFLGLSVLSCTTRDDKRVLLDKVDRYMTNHPDSALILLNELKHPDKLRGVEAADYALLMTQARDRNYLDSLQSDSLITIAVEYYKGVANKVKAGKALFYAGKLNSLAHKYPEAMKAYLEADRLLEGTDAYKLRGMLQEYMSYVSFDQGVYADAANHCRRAIALYELSDESTPMPYVYRDLANVYLVESKNDSVRYCLERGLSLLKDTTDYVRSSLLSLQATLAKREKKYDEAVGYLLAAIEAGKAFNDHYRYFLDLGSLYMDMGELKKAESSYNSTFLMKDNYLSAGAYFYLYQLEKKKSNYYRAITYKEKSDSLLNLVRNEKLQSQILTLQRKYDNEKLKSENIRIKLEKERYLYLFSFIFLVIVASVALLLRVIRKKYRRHFLRNIEMIKRNERALKEYAYQISQLKQAEERESEKKKEDLAQLNRKVACLAAENRELRENVFVEALYLLDQLKQGTLILERMTNVERMHLLDYMDLIFASYITRLSAEYQLTKTDLILAALLKVGFTNNQLITVFDCEMNSVYKMKQRLKGHLNLSKEESLEKFILFY